jgi:transposase
LVWQEYHEANPDGYGYSRFCDLLGAFAEQLTPTMRETHKAGEKMFVDSSGATIPIVLDARTGQTHQAQILVACLGASSFTCVEARRGQTAADWVCAQANALAAFGGAPQIIVPDNPKSAFADQRELARMSVADLSEAFAARTLRTARLAAPRR